MDGKVSRPPPHCHIHPYLVVPNEGPGQRYARALHEIPKHVKHGTEV